MKSLGVIERENNERAAREAYPTVVFDALDWVEDNVGIFSIDGAIDPRDKIGNVLANFLRQWQENPRESITFTDFHAKLALIYADAGEV